MRGRLWQVALRTSIVYGVFASVWIVLTDRILRLYIVDPEQIMRLSAIKGLVFVAITVLLLYLVLWSQLRKRERESAERARAERALRESEERYRTLVENAAEGITVAQKGMLKFINRATEELGGHSREELSSRPFSDFLHPDDQARVIASQEKLVTGERTFIEEEVRMIHKDGTTRWLQVRSASIVWDDAPATLNFFRDVTERNRQQREIVLLSRIYAVLSNVNQEVARAKSPETFLEQACRAIVENGHFLVAWIGRIDPETMAVVPVTAWGEGRDYVRQISVFASDNPEGRGPTGMAIRQRRGVIFNDFVNDPRAGPWRQQAIPFGIRAVAGFPIMMAGRVWGALTIYAEEPGFFSDKDVTLIEEVAGSIGFALENLENERRRQQAEAALRESEQFNREVIAGASEGIIVYDRDFRLQVWNSFMENLTGLSAADLLGKSIFEFFPEFREQRLEEHLERALSGETLTSPNIYFSVPLTGKCGWTSSIFSPRFDADGRICGVICVVHDITAQKQVEDDKERLEAQLSQAQKMESVGRLAGGVAHDFNNMLSVITGHADLALSLVDPGDPLQRHLLEIQEAALRSADLTRQLLAFARRQTVSPKVLDLNDTIAGMLKMLRRLIGEDIDLTWNPGYELWKVRVDPSQIDQILANLAVNARDAIAEVGKVTIETANVSVDGTHGLDYPADAAGEYALLTVADTGVGMAPDVLDHIFEPFFTTKELGKGTGLGLATVYGIVKQNNGFIQVSSEPGQGTTFRIYLPRYEADDDQLRIASRNHTARGGPETILVVEDAAQILALCRTILERQGYNVLTAPTPLQALHLVEKLSGRIHLLVTDVVMPEMNGRELMDRIRVFQPSVKCLFMSGYTADVISPQRIFEEGLHFIQKPFNSDGFAEAVRDILEHA